MSDITKITCNTILKYSFAQGEVYWIYLPRTEEDIANNYWPQVMVKANDLIANNPQVIPTLDRLSKETRERLESDIALS